MTETANVLEEGRKIGSAKAIAGDIADHILGIHASFIGSGRLALAAGGPGFSNEDLLASFDSMVSIAENLTQEAGYGFISIEPSFGLFCFFDYLTESVYNGGAQARWVVDLCDVLVLDGFAYQILGPGHIERLKSHGELFDCSTDFCREATLSTLAAGHLALQFGTPSDWLIVDPPDIGMLSPSVVGLGHRRRDSAIQDRARELLAPCLISEEGARDLWTDRRRSI